MRELMTLAAVILFAPTTGAKVWVTAYRCDETTPLSAIDPNHPTIYRDIMVGTRLVFVISSDTGEPWQGALLLAPDDAEYGRLSGRGYTSVRPDTSGRAVNYPDSCLEAAGTGALIWNFNDSQGVGLQFGTGRTPYITGGHAPDYHTSPIYQNGIVVGYRGGGTGQYGTDIRNLMDCF